jgi:hypothetical protein
VERERECAMGESVGKTGTRVLCSDWGYNTVYCAYPTLKTTIKIFERVPCVVHRPLGELVATLPSTCRHPTSRGLSPAPTATRIHTRAAMRRVVSTPRFPRQDGSNARDEQPYDTFEDLHCDTAHEFVSACTLVARYMNGTTIRGRKDRRMPGSTENIPSNLSTDDGWGTGLLLADTTYTLHCRVSPPGAFQAAHHVAMHATYGTRDTSDPDTDHSASYFNIRGGCLGKPPFVVDSTCTTCQSYIGKFTPPSIVAPPDHPAGKVFATPIVMTLRLRCRRTAIADDVVTVTTFIPQSMYNSVSLSAALESALPPTTASPTPAPCSSFHFRNWHECLRSDHVKLWNVVTRHVEMSNESVVDAADAITKKSSDNADRYKTLAKLRRGAQVPPGTRARSTSPRPVSSFPDEYPENGPVHLFELCSQLTCGVAMPTDISHTKHPMRRASGAPLESAIQPFLVAAATVDGSSVDSVLSSAPGMSQATRTAGGVASKISLIASHDLANSLSITAIVSLMVSPTTKDALPTMLTHPLSYRLIIATAFRLACQPALFGLVDERTYPQKLAAAELNELVESTWHPYDGHKPIVAREGMFVDATPLYLDTLIESAIARTSGFVRDMRIAAVLPSNRPVSMTVVRRARQWQQAAMHTVSYLFGGDATITRCTPSTGKIDDVSDPLMAARATLFRRIGILRGGGASEYDCPLTAVLGDVWPGSETSTTQMRDCVVDIILSAEQELRTSRPTDHGETSGTTPDPPSQTGRPESPDSPGMPFDPSAVYSPSSTVTVGAELARFASECASSCSEADQPTGVLDAAIRNRGTWLAMGRICQDPFAPYIADDDETTKGSWQMSREERETATGPGSLLVQALAYGGSDTYDPPRLDFLVHGPSIHSKCFKCDARIPSIHTAVPLPHSECTRCQAQLCVDCGTLVTPCDMGERSVVCPDCTRCIQGSLDTAEEACAESATVDKNDRTG